MMMMMMMMMTVMMMAKMLFMIYAVCFYDSQSFLCMITRKYINVSHIALYRLIQRFIDYTVIKHGGPLNQFWFTGSRVNNYMS